jgi:CubicO group peptidase (beta-lactamase class C family)
MTKVRRRAARVFPAVFPFAVLSISFLGLATGATAAADPDLEARIDAWLAPAVEAGLVAGCVLVADGGEVVYERCFGLADYELGVPNGPETRFAIASITKALQLVLAARLSDEGAFAMSDTLSRWLPDFPLADETTVLDLANHTAGVPHRVTEPEEECMPHTPAEMVELAKQKGLVVENRGERHYSSAGYTVLARVLELAGGDDWGALMQRYVFTPAGMDHTLHPAGLDLIPGRATSYSWSLDGLQNTTPKHLSFLAGAGSLYSTPRDLWRAVRAVVAGDFGETARAWVVRERDEFAWTGRTNGYRALCDYDVARERAVIICANVKTGVVDRLRSDLPKFLDGEEVAPLPRLDRIEFVDVPTAELRGFEGRYELRPGTILDVTARDGSLFANEWEMMPLGGDRFLSIRDFNRVLFVRDDAGAILRMDWGEGDPPYEIPRLGDLKDVASGGGR